MVADTVQLMVEVAGLYSQAPALEVMRPAGMAQTLAREQLRQLEELRTERESTSQRLLALQAEHEQLNVEHSTLRNSLEQRQQHFSEQQQLLRESREQLKLEFEQLAGRIFEAKGQAFSQHSQQSLDALLKPFREQIDQFRTKVEDIHYKETQQQAALTQELLHLKELNRQITQEAHDLSTALRGQKKAQGNWGELILENVLERSGLRAGTDFKREVSITNSEGQRQRPDVLVMLHVFGVDEYLEGATRFVVAALIEHRIVDGHVDGVLGGRRLDLVGGAFEKVRALELLVHLLQLRRRRSRRHLGLVVLGLDHRVIDDLAGDFQYHFCSLGPPQQAPALFI